MNPFSAVRNSFRRYALVTVIPKGRRWSANAVFKYLERYRAHLDRRSWNQDDDALVIEEMARIRATIGDEEWTLRKLVVELEKSEIPTVVRFAESMPYQSDVPRKFWDLALTDHRFAAVAEAGNNLVFESVSYLPRLVNRLAALYLFGWIVWGILILWPTIYALRTVFTVDAGDSVVANLAAARPFVVARFVRFDGQTWWGSIFFVALWVMCAAVASSVRGATVKAK